ncbi:molybdenum cofactor biosynthesis protein MoaE [Sphingobacterium chungjuense]
MGTVRNHPKGKRLIRLEYECYESMTLKEFRNICEQTKIAL